MKMTLKDILGAKDYIRDTYATGLAHLSADRVGTAASVISAANVFSDAGRSLTSTATKYMADGSFYYPDFTGICGRLDALAAHPGASALKSKVYAVKKDLDLMRSDMDALYDYVHATGLSYHTLGDICKLIADNRTAKAIHRVATHGGTILSKGSDLVSILPKTMSSPADALTLYVVVHDIRTIGRDPSDPIPTTIVYKDPSGWHDDACSFC